MISVIVMAGLPACWMLACWMLAYGMPDAKLQEVLSAEKAVHPL